MYCHQDALPERLPALDVLLVPPLPALPSSSVRLFPPLPALPSSSVRLVPPLPSRSSISLLWLLKCSKLHSKLLLYNLGLHPIIKVNLEEY